LILLEEDWQHTANDPTVRTKVGQIAFHVVVGYGGGLRGEEIVKADLGHTAQLLQTSAAYDIPHVTIALLGKFKGEHHDRCHLLPMALKTRSGIKIGLWVHRLVLHFQSIGVTKGPILRVNRRSAKGVRGKITDFDPDFHKYLARLQARWPKVLDPSIDVQTECSLRRAMRRSSTNEARNQGIPKDIIEANQRWRTVERARGKAPSVGLLEHYSEARCLVPTITRYSASL
jgi:hypothetical protein